jgi:xylulokinase
LLAVVTGVPVVRSADAEAGARGAFLIAAVATGRAASEREAADAYIRPGDVFDADPARVARYAGAYEAFLTVRNATAAAWPTLAALRGDA